VLKQGGVFMATREHVVDDGAQLARFLRRHPVHRLAGGEHAYSLDRYLNAIRAAGLSVEAILGPWDSVINAFPIARSEDELRDLPRTVRRLRPGRLYVSVTRRRYA
jgi:hypothetical protein